jgi:hypothetical protein
VKLPSTRLRLRPGQELIDRHLGVLGKRGHGGGYSTRPCGKPRRSQLKSPPAATVTCIQRRRCRGAQ